MKRQAQARKYVAINYMYKQQTVNTSILKPLLISRPGYNFRSPALLCHCSVTTATQHCWGSTVATAVVTPIAAPVITHHSALAVPLLQLLLLLLNTAVPLFPLLLSLTTARSRCHCCHCCCHSLTTALLLPVFLRVRKVVYLSAMMRLVNEKNSEKSEGNITGIKKCKSKHEQHYSCTSRSTTDYNNVVRGTTTGIFDRTNTVRNYKVVRVPTTVSLVNLPVKWNTISSLRYTYQRTTSSLLLTAGLGGTLTIMLEKRP
jgi:hypothetical protein